MPDNEITCRREGCSKTFSGENAKRARGQHERMCGRRKKPGAKSNNDVEETIRAKAVAYRAESEELARKADDLDKLADQARDLL